MAELVRVGGDHAHLGIVAGEQGRKRGRAAFVRTVDERQEDIIRERRANDLLEMPRRVADVEICQGGSLLDSSVLRLETT